MKKISILCLALSLAGCQDFLDVPPKGRVIASTIEDYDLLLNGGSRTLHTTANDDVLSLTADDFTLSEEGGTDINNPDFQDFQLFSWGPHRFYNNSTPVTAWNSSYQNIYTFNKIINEVDNAEIISGYTEQDKLRVKAEAKYGRALDYLFLVNIFGKAYSASSPSDLAVPIITQADVTQTSPERASVKAVYDFILNDLTEAVEHLPKRSKVLTRPNLGAGYALLSRAYLYKGDYQKALENAEKALQEKNDLQNYTTLNTSEEKQNAYAVEQYAFHYFDYSGGTFNPLSEDLLSVLDQTNDTRFSKFYADYTAYGFGIIPSVFIEVNSSTSVGEMYVTRAECLARLGRNTEAIEVLNSLRQNRLSNYADLTSADFATDLDLLKFCLEERRREVFRTMTRLFDLKRTSTDPNLVKTITHHFDGVDYTTTSDSEKLVLPIPAQVLKFNPSW